MREIKFRGKRVDNGEWVYGNYVKHLPYTPAPMVHDINKSLEELGVNNQGITQPLEVVHEYQFSSSRYTKGEC